MQTVCAKTVITPREEQREQQNASIPKELFMLRVSAKTVT